MNLQEFNWSDLSKKSYSEDGYTQHDIEKLKELDHYTSDYLDNRPHHLASIACAMQVALEDAEIGTFDKENTLAMSYFLEVELNALGSIISIRNDVLFHLKEAEKRKGG